MTPLLSRPTTHRRHSRWPAAIGALIAAGLVLVPTSSLAALPHALERSWRPFGEYTWVFSADVLLGALFGVLAMLVRHRDAAPRTRKWWGLAGVVIGTLAGGGVFLPFFVLALFAYFFTPVSPVALFGLTVVALLVVAVGLAFPRQWRRWQ